MLWRLRAVGNVIGQIVVLIVLGVALTAFVGAMHEAIMTALAQ